MRKKKQPKNPFVVNGFWYGKYFCDREKELQWLYDNLANERNMVLYSWRRYGKSALIQYFLQQIETRKSAETLYIDLMGTQSFKQAIEEITRAVYHQFGRTKSGMSATLTKFLSHIGVSLSFDAQSSHPQITMNWVNAPPPERSLQAIGDFLKTRNKTIIITFDEFQQIVHYKNPNVEAQFRKWVQAFPQLRFIFSGSHRHMMHSMFSDSNRPFYRSAQLLELPAIPIEKYTTFIQKHFSESKKQISKKHISKIYSWARGQTYTVQLICNQLFGSCDSVTDNDIKRVYKAILYQEKPVFANYAHLFTQTQWAVLKACAKEEPVANPLSSAFINKHQLGAASTVSSVLKTLQQKEFMYKDEGHYYIHDVLFARWLQGK